jgi:hypothetical protein
MKIGASNFLSRLKWMVHSLSLDQISLYSISSSLMLFPHINNRIPRTRNMILKIKKMQNVVHSVGFGLQALRFCCLNLLFSSLAFLSFPIKEFVSKIKRRKIKETHLFGEFLSQS